MAWFSTDDGRHINTDWFNDDERKKYKQIRANKKEADERNGKTDSSTSYEKMLSLEEKKQILYDFADRTGINVSMTGIQEIPDDTYTAIFKTVEGQLNKYGKNSFILTEISMREDDFEPDETAYAKITHAGILKLNPKYFKKSKAELDNRIAKDVDSKFSVPGDTNMVIIHELGHARWNNQLIEMWRKYGGDINEWRAMYDTSSDKEWKWLSSIDVPRYRNGQAYKHFIDKIDSFQKSMRDSEYLKKQWGGNVNLGIKGLIDPRYNHTDAISEYATTDIHEMMAEAWADVEVNGNKASYMSKEVVKHFM